jgi:polysaccharide biosynthesis/export protein
MKAQTLTRLSPTWGGRLVALACCALFGAGCAAAPQGRAALQESPAPPSAVAEINSALTSAATSSASAADYRLGAEDLLEITIFNIPEGFNLSQGGTGPIPRKVDVRVSQAGMITLPLLGDVPAARLTTADLEQSLRKRYDEFLHDPQVGVYIKEYRGQQVSVSGAVSKPGMYQLTGPRTLVDLLSNAGGINEKARSQVHLYRQNAEGRQSYVIDLVHLYRQNAEGRQSYVIDLYALANNPGQVNMPVQAGDIINVPLAGTFFVDGAVNRPGPYPLSRAYTLTQALVVAGGVNDTLAAYSDVSIFRRRIGAEPDRIPIDLKNIFAGNAPGPYVEAEDVIIVPVSTAKYIVERFIGKIGLGGSMF